MDQLELFRFDTDMDFETAYRMLGNFDSVNIPITPTNTTITNNNLLTYHSGSIQQQQQQQQDVLNHSTSSFLTSHIDESILRNRMIPSTTTLEKPTNLSPHEMNSLNTGIPDDLHIQESSLPTSLYPLPHQDIHFSRLTNGDDIPSYGPNNSVVLNQSNPIIGNNQPSTTTLSYDNDNDGDDKNNNNRFKIKPSQKETLPYNYKGASDKHVKALSHQDILLHNHLSSQGIGDELLSTFETNAIEEFLDNLLSHENNQNKTYTASVPLSPVKHQRLNDTNIKLIKEGSIKKHMESYNTTQKNNVTSINTVDEIVTLNDTNTIIKSPNTSDFEDMAISSIGKQDIDTDYIPRRINIPEITVDLLDCPEYLTSKTDSLEFKKWKHVELEKLRRNQIKKAFDQLISLRNKYSKPINNNSKRISKYQLLTQVKHDIQNLVKANRCLEKIAKRESGEIL